MADTFGRCGAFLRASIVLCGACGQGVGHGDAHVVEVAAIDSADAGDRDAPTDSAHQSPEQAALAREIEAMVAEILALPAVTQTSLAQTLEIALEPMARIGTKSSAHRAVLPSSPFDDVELVEPADPDRARIVSFRVRDGLEITPDAFGDALAPENASLSTTPPEGGERNIFEVDKPSGAKVFYTFRPDAVDREDSLGVLTAVAIWTVER